MPITAKKYPGDSRLREIFGYIKTELDKKVNTVSGKGLSTEDYTSAEKTKLGGIAAGAEVNVQSNWNENNTGSDAYILNKPTTIAGYGITDAKIASGTIILGSNSITPLTKHQDISGKADKSATVSTVTWDSTNKKLTKTINGSTTDVVTGATILGGLTKSQVTTALGYTPPTSDTNTHRPIQVNGTQILGNNTTALNLKAGSNVSLSNSSGTVTIASTNTNTTYTVATGDSNGQIKVTPSSGSAYNVSVKGLGSRAYDSTEYIPKITYEYNKEIAFGNTGKLLIGKFPCYDSNVTIDIDTTTSDTYHATAILATQNINDSHGGTIKWNAYGDEADTITPNLYLYYPNNSRYIEIYFSPASWSKNLIHIRCVALKATPTNICESISAIPSTATTKPINMYKTGSVASATTASKLGTSTVGGTTTPIYLNAGVPTALGYTIAKSVPSNAVFTDTNTTYTLSVNGNNIKLSPSTGSANSITVPYATSAGTATKVDIDTEYTSSWHLLVGTISTSNSLHAFSSIFIQEMKWDTYKDTYFMLGSYGTDTELPSNGILRFYSDDSTSMNQCVQLRVSDTTSANYTDVFLPSTGGTLATQSWVGKPTKVSSTTASATISGVTVTAHFELYSNGMKCIEVANANAAAASYNITIPAKYRSSYISSSRPAYFAGFNTQYVSSSTSTVRTRLFGMTADTLIIYASPFKGCWGSFYYI